MNFLQQAELSHTIAKAGGGDIGLVRPDLYPHRPEFCTVLLQTEEGIMPALVINYIASAPTLCCAVFGLN